MNILLHSAGLLYGLVTLSIFTISALLDRETWRRRSREEHEELRKASHHLWSLSPSPPPDSLRHNFLTLSTGQQLPYLSSDTKTSSHKPLLLFLHGFPDSCHLFSNFITSPALRAAGAKLVSLDLPGCGGSDGLDHYGPNDVLNAVAEAIAVLKGRYRHESEDSHCIVVGHDWGGVIASRLAAETAGLIDRLVMVNSVYTPLLKHNAHLSLLSTRHTLVTHLTSNNLLSTSHLRLAYRDIKPLLRQLSLSSYIFLFNLPCIHLSKHTPWLTTHLLRTVHRHRDPRHSPTGTPASATTLQSAHPDQPTKPPASLLARSTALTSGPSAAECATSPHYTADVATRARTRPPGAWPQRIRLYREGASTAPWTLHPHLQNHFDIRPVNWQDRSHKFTCPVTVIFGLQDLALSPEMCLDGMERFFPSVRREDAGAGEVAESQIVRIRGCGHWSVVEPVGERVVEATLLWGLDARFAGAAHVSLEDVLRRADRTGSGVQVTAFRPA